MDIRPLELGRGKCDVLIQIPDIKLNDTIDELMEKISNSKTHEASSFEACSIAHFGDYLQLRLKCDFTNKFMVGEVFEEPVKDEGPLTAAEAKKLFLLHKGNRTKIKVKEFWESVRKCIKDGVNDMWFPYAEYADFLLDLKPELEDSGFLFTIKRTEIGVFIVITFKVY